jgi:hypothetical protein
MRIVSVARASWRISSAAAALFVLPLLLSVPTQAQAPLQLSTGYSFAYSPRTDVFPRYVWNGLNTSLAIKPWKRVPELSTVVSADGMYSSYGVKSYSLLAGPKLSWSRENYWRAKTIFAQGLLGGTHFSSAGPSTGVQFAWDIGGGLDVPITPRIGWRAIQIDYRAHPGWFSQKEVRFTTGLTFGFKMPSRD